MMPAEALCPPGVQADRYSSMGLQLLGQGGEVDEVERYGPVKVSSP